MLVERTIRLCYLELLQYRVCACLYVKHANLLAVMKEDVGDPTRVVLFARGVVTTGRCNAHNPSVRFVMFMLASQH